LSLPFSACSKRTFFVCNEVLCSLSKGPKELLRHKAHALNDGRQQCRIAVLKILQQLLGPGAALRTILGQQLVNNQLAYDTRARHEWQQEMAVQLRTQYDAVHCESWTTKQSLSRQQVAGVAIQPYVGSVTTILATYGASKAPNWNWKHEGR
jgi:hypothetical protein